MCCYVAFGQFFSRDQLQVYNECNSVVIRMSLSNVIDVVSRAMFLLLDTNVACFHFSDPLVYKNQGEMRTRKAYQ